MEQDDGLIVLLLLYLTITHGCYIWSIVLFLLKVRGHYALIVLYSTTQRIMGYDDTLVL